MPMSKKHNSFCVALVGHPNVGKSLLFHRLTGKYVNVSNYPGTTVEFTSASGRAGQYSFTLIDTPGLYSLNGQSEEEKAAARWLKSNRPHLILQVIDMRNLPRMLKLTSELASLKHPVILVLNMADEAARFGVEVDTSLLSRKLGVPVVSVISTTGEGVGQLLDVVAECLAGTISPRLYSLMPYKELVGCCFRQGSHKPGDRSLILDRVLLHPLWGWLFLAVILYLGFYRFVGIFGAGYLVDTLDYLFLRYLQPPLHSWVSDIFPEKGFQELLMGEYGMLSMGLRYAITIILPVITSFFLFFSLLEDSGYLPRLAYLVTKPLSFLGLNGKAALPLTLGFGCGTMAVAVTRILDSRRERFLATFLLALGVPCSAQLGLMTALLSAIPGALLLWLLVVGLTGFTAGRLAHLLLPGKRQPLVLELPPLRWPRLEAVWYKTRARVVWYFQEIVPIFLGISLVLWLLQASGFLRLFFLWLQVPLSLLGLPEETSFVIITGFLRRDYGAAGLFSLFREEALGGKELLTASILLTLFLPCLAQVSLMYRERGWLESTAIIIMVSFIAFAVSFIVRVILFW